MNKRNYRISTLYRQTLILRVRHCSSAEPPPFRHARGVPPFPLSGKSTPQRLLRNRGKVGIGGKIAERRSTFSAKPTDFRFTGKVGVS